MCAVMPAVSLSMVCMWHAPFPPLQLPAHILRRQQQNGDMPCGILGPRCSFACCSLTSLLLQQDTANGCCGCAEALTTANKLIFSAWHCEPFFFGNDVVVVVASMGSCWHQHPAHPTWQLGRGAQVHDDLAGVCGAPTFARPILKCFVSPACLLQGASTAPHAAVQGM